MGRNKYPEITEQRILDSAYKLFLEKGWGNTTIQDIIDDLGDLTRGAFYHHFKSKEDIIDAVTTRMFYNENPFEKVESNQSLNAFDKLKNIMNTLLNNKISLQLLKQIDPSVRESPQIIAKQLHECKTVVAPLIESLLVKGLEDGSIVVERPGQVAEVISYLMVLWVSPQFQNNDETVFVNVIETFADVLNRIGVPVVDQELKELSLQVYREIHT